MLLNKRAGRTVFLCLTGVMALLAPGILMTLSASEAGASTTSSNQIAAAAAIVKQYSKIPTTLGNNIPLKHAPPKGGVLFNLNCGASGGPECALLQNAEAAAAKAIGWRFKSVTIDLNEPATVVAGIQQALAEGATVITESGTPYQLIEHELPAIKAAHAIYVPTAAGSMPISSTIPAVIDGAIDSSAQAKLDAAYITSKSNGKANILAVSVPEIAAEADTTTDFQKDIAFDCPGCKVTVLNLPINDQAPTGVDPIVSAVQKDRSINWVTTVAPEVWGGLTSALAGAGITDVKITGTGCAPQNMTQIKQGEMEAVTCPSVAILGWMSVDSALRSVEGMSVPAQDGGWPKMIFQKFNVTPAFETAQTVSLPANYPQLFKKLWKVKS